VWRIAWPIILANGAVPLLGIVDTAVVGHLGRASAIGAVALGALIFSFVYWGFGFLRMGTTGLTAQALGREDAPEIQANLYRALVVGASLGGLLVFLQWPIGAYAFWLIEGGAAVEDEALAYFHIRIWGAPAALMNFAVLGWFIGLHKSRNVLIIQVTLNLLNIALDLLFVMGFGWGVPGVAIATILSEWTALCLGVLLVLREQRTTFGTHQFFSVDWRAILDAQAMKQTISVNGDIFIRSLCLVFAFAWFTSQSARMGDVVLAANTVLMQFFNIGAHVIDAFAFAAEAMVGTAVGARDHTGLRAAVVISSQLAFAAALILSILFLIAGVPAIHGLTDLDAVRATATEFLPWAVAMPLIALACFQLDGIFIGATRTAEMRNAMIVSLAAYLALWAFAFPAFGNHGHWGAFAAFFVIRAVTLGALYPRLERTAIEGAA
jgi:MATE family multidrug resistance protein